MALRRPETSSGYKNVLVLRFPNLTAYHNHPKGFKNIDFQASGLQERFGLSRSGMGPRSLHFHKGPVEAPSVSMGLTRRFHLCMVPPPEPSRRTSSSL